MFEKIAINTTSIIIAFIVLLILFRVFNLWNLLPGGSGVIGIFNQYGPQPQQDPLQTMSMQQMQGNGLITADDTMLFSSIHIA